MQHCRSAYNAAKGMIVHIDAMFSNTVDTFSMNAGGCHVLRELQAISSFNIGHLVADSYDLGFID